MSLSDCIKCWNTPCTCGYGYKEFSQSALANHIASITQYRTKDEAKEIISSAIEEVDKLKQWTEPTNK